MRVLLIQPNFLVKTLHPPLGLAYIAGALKNKFDTRILDCTFLGGFEELEQGVRDSKADVVGISCLTTMFEDAIKIAGIVKNTGVSKVILGGPHATLFPKECIQNKNVDIVVRGEGEAVTGIILEALERNASLRGIPGVLYKEAGHIFENGPPGSIEDLDSLPLPAYELLPGAYLDPKRATMSLITSRGCPFRCNFCQPVQRLLFGSIVKNESVDRIIAQIRHLSLNFGIKTIMFADDTFNINEGRVVDLCNRIIGEKLDNLCYRCNIRANIIPKPQTVELMWKAGFRCVSYGAESGSQVILDELCKGTTVSQNIETARLFKRYGFEIYLYLMLGSPSESRLTLAQTVEMIKKIRPDQARVSITSPLPGTELEKLCKEKGILRSGISAGDSAYYESFAQRPIELIVSIDEILRAKRKIEAISRRARILRKLRQDPFYIFYLMKRAAQKLVKT